MIVFAVFMSKNKKTINIILVSDLYDLLANDLSRYTSFTSHGSDRISYNEEQIINARHSRLFTHSQIPKVTYIRRWKRRNKRF